MALGRSDVFLKLEIIKKTASLVVIVSAFKLGVLPWMAISAFVFGPFCVMVNAWPNRKLLNYTIGMQLRDVMPTALVCVVEAAVVFAVGMVAERLKPMLGVADTGASLMAFLGAKLALQGVLGAGAFFALAFAFRLRPMCEYARMATNVLKGRWPKLAEALERRLAA